MSKDSDDCEVMNELFDSREEPERKPLIHWRPIAYVDENGKIIRKLTEKEQQEWLINEINRQKGLDK
jgi:hypothetical protein